MIAHWPHTDDLGAFLYYIILHAKAFKDPLEFSLLKYCLFFQLPADGLITKARQERIAVEMLRED